MTPSADRWSLRRLLFIGYLTLFVFVFGIGAWAAVTRISGAVVGAGAIEVEGNRQVVQHPTGGVIKAINARDGDEVQQGDVLVELDGEELFPELGIVEGQWFELLARKSRLSAERDGLDAIDFDPELVARAETSSGIATLIAAQEQQFAARRKLQQEEDAPARRAADPDREPERRPRIALQRSTRSQIELLTREIEGQQTLLDQGLTQVTRVLTPRRELARLEGAAGQAEAGGRREPRQDRRDRDRAACG